MEARKKERKKEDLSSTPMYVRTDPLNLQTYRRTCTHVACVCVCLCVHALVSYKCANLSVNARACAGVHVLDRFAGTIRKKKKGRQGESEEGGGRGGGWGIVHENYILAGTCT